MFLEKIQCLNIYFDDLCLCDNTVCSLNKYYVSKLDHIQENNIYFYF